MGAHIDHLGVNRDGAINYGADDNASGAALVMERGRLFKLCAIVSKRTMLFAVRVGVPLSPRVDRARRFRRSRRQ